MDYRGTNITRGINNNNPGNLIYITPSKAFKGQIGSDGKFGIYSSFELGVRAAFFNLRNYFEDGINTVKSIIDKWDRVNNYNYRNFVSDYTGYTLNQKLTWNKETAIRLMRAIFLFENYSYNLKYFPDSVLNYGYDSIQSNSDNPNPSKAGFIVALLITSYFLFK